MGIDKIDIASLDPRFKQMAESVDDGNGVLEDEKGEVAALADALANAIEAGNAQPDDFRKIFGYDINKSNNNSSYATKPQVKAKAVDLSKISKSVTKQVTDFFKNNYNIQGTPEQILDNFEQNFSMFPNGANEKNNEFNAVKQQFVIIADAIKNIGYNDKASVEALEKKVKERVEIKGGIAKDILKVLLKNAENTQRQKEMNDLVNEFNKQYDAQSNSVGSKKYGDNADETVRNENMEQILNKLKKDSRFQKSYYKEFLSNGSWVQKRFRNLTFRKAKMSEFENRHLMKRAVADDSRLQEYSNKESSSEIREETNKKLEELNVNDKYHKKAMSRYDMSSYEIGSFQNSSMKTRRKNIATQNKVDRIAREGVSAEDAEKADKKSTVWSVITFGAVEKKDLYLLDRMINKGLITKNDKGYDVSKLSEILRSCVGGEPKLSPTNDDDYAISEMSKAKEAIVAAMMEYDKQHTKNGDIRPQSSYVLSNTEVEHLVKLCGYKVGAKHKVNAIEAVAGTVSAGIGAAFAAKTNTRKGYEININNHQRAEVEIVCASAEAAQNLLKHISVLEGDDVSCSLSGVTIKIVADQKYIKKYGKLFGKDIVATALKTMIPAAILGVLTNIEQKNEIPVTRLLCDCTTFEDYEQFIEGCKLDKKHPLHKHPDLAEALKLLAMRYTTNPTTEGGPTSFDCNSFRKVLQWLAGNEKLNKEELLFSEKALKEFEKNNGINVPDVTNITETEQTQDPCGGETPCTARVVKEDERYVDVKIPRMKRSELKAWGAAVQAFYPCLVDDYGPAKAARILKAAQGVRDGNYDVKRLLDFVNKKVSELEKMSPDEYKGFDMHHYINLRRADDLPDDVLMPDKIGNCEKVRDAKVGKVTIADRSGTKKANNTDYDGHRQKVADGATYVEFDDCAGGGREKVPEDKTPQEVVDQRAKDQNKKIILRQ